MCLRGISNNAMSAPKLADHHYKASNHLYINISFLFMVAPSYKQFDPWDVECVLSLLDS